MSKIIVALDYPSGDEALKVAEKIGTKAYYKVGMELFNAEGPSVVKYLTGKGYQVFLDLKYHDIPNTVAGAARTAVRTGCFMFNVHAIGGKEMMYSASQAAAEEAQRLGIEKPKLIAVTVLTSMSEQELERDLKITSKLNDYVVHLAILAKEAGLDGVVASPREIENIRKACGREFLIVTPGVRPAWSATNDQKRIMTPAEAVGLGADFLVIGRPITAHSEPAIAFEKITQEIGGLS